MKNYILLAGIILLLVGGALVLKPQVSPERKQDTVATPTGSSEIPPAFESYTMDDVVEHNSEQDCWQVVENKVYDVTSFITSHPGGKDIVEGCGKDATSLFQSEREHQEKNAAMYLPKYLIGTLR